MKRQRPTFPILLLGLVCLVAEPARAAEHGAAASAPPSGHGEAKADAKKAGGEGAGEGKGEKTEAAKPQYQRGKPLNGFYDCNLLRDTRRVTSYRYALNGLVQTINQGTSVWQVSIDCAIEFGSESGLAEIGEHESALRDDIGKLIERFEPSQLQTIAGKRRLKEAMILAINQRLTTVQVRQVYWTKFLIGK